MLDPKSYKVLAWQKISLTILDWILVGFISFGKGQLYVVLEL